MRYGTSLVMLAFALAACQPLPPTITPVPLPGTGVPGTLDPSGSPLTLEVLNSELSLGEERLAFRMRDGSGRALTGTDVESEVEILAVRTDGALASVASGPALYFGSDLPGGGSWVTYSGFESSGPWVLRVKASRPDGTTATGETTLDVAGRTALPRVGVRPPIDDAGGAASGASASTDPEPDPELYSLTVAEAVDSGKPTVIFLGSPANCTSDACGPTLEQVKATKARYAGRVNFLHVETHDPDAPTQPSAAAAAWNLPSEPWTFVLDANGRITNRIEGPLDSVELGLLLDRVLAGGTDSSQATSAP